MSKIRNGFLLLVIIALVLGMVGSPSVLAQDTPDFPVKVAVFGPFTGGAASIGQEQLNWARLAVDDFNAATGWSVELVEADTELDPAKGVTAAEGVIADADVYAAVGPAGSQVVAATGEMFTDASLVNVSPSATDPTLTEGDFETFYRVVPTDAVQGPTIGRYLSEVLGVTELYVIDDQTTYSVGLADAAEATFTELGGEVVGRESISQDLVDLSSLATVVANSGAQAVFFPGQIASQGVLLATGLVEQGSDVILFGADGFYSPDDFIGDAAGVTEGAYVSAFAPDISGLESSADTVERYTEEYGTFGTFGPPTYVAAQSVLEAMQRAYEADGELSREAVAAEMANTDIELSILGGPLAFAENGDVEGAEFYIFQVIDEAFVLQTSSGDEMDDE
jgi:branched-chain amino acid transport system substrate-binding protein